MSVHKEKRRPQRLKDRFCSNYILEYATFFEDCYCICQKVDMKILFTHWSPLALLPEFLVADLMAFIMSSRMYIMFPVTQVRTFLQLLFRCLPVNYCKKELRLLCKDAYTGFYKGTDNTCSAAYVVLSPVNDVMGL
jgi:hypothetical protein